MKACSTPDCTRVARRGRGKCWACEERAQDPEKRKARYQRKNRAYKHSEKGRAADRRYDQSDTGKRAMQRRNARRIYVGGRCVTRAGTLELAVAIRAHIQERRREFVERQQSRAEA